MVVYLRIQEERVVTSLEREGDQGRFHGGLGGT